MKWTRRPDDAFGRVYIVQDLHPDPVFNVWVDLDTNTVHHDGHVVSVPEAAIADRLKLYGVTTEEEALEHILWEHHVRINPATSPKQAKMPDAVAANFDRVWGAGHKAIRGLPMTPTEAGAQGRRHNEIYSPRRTELRGGR